MKNKLINYIVVLSRNDTVRRANTVRLFSDIGIIPDFETTIFIHNEADATAKSRHFSPWRKQENPETTPLGVPGGLFRLMG